MPISVTAKTFLALGAASAALAVLLGAFAAHALKGRLAADMLAVYHTANQYHFIHSLGLLLLGVLALLLPGSAALKWAGWLMVAGMVLFSGSLYLLGAAGMRWLGAVTPIGGVALIVAWVVLCVGVLRGST